MTSGRTAVLACACGFCFGAPAAAQRPFDLPKRALDRLIDRRDPSSPGSASTAGGAFAQRHAVQEREYMTETSDRWKLAARRYWPKNARSLPQPIILCHGFTFNARFFDLSPEISLARFLAENGYDVWAVDLRGCGKSHKWALTANGGGELLIGRFADKLTNRGVPPTGFVSLDPRFAKWNFDDHVDRDVPALLGLVCRETGASATTWIGHSMGGNVMLAYLAKNGQDARVGKLVTIGSQVTMSQTRMVVEYLGELLARREAQLAGQRISTGDLFASANDVFYNQANVAEDVVRRLVADQDAPSAGLVKQYLELSKTGRLGNANRQFDYSANLAKIRCPMFIAAGSVDQVATPTDQVGLYERAVNAKKTLLLFGRAVGMSVDYGHCDAIVGKNAPREVYPRILRWIQEN